MASIVKMSSTTRLIIHQGQQCLTHMVVPSIFICLNHAATKYQRDIIKQIQEMAPEHVTHDRRQLKIDVRPGRNTSTCWANIGILAKTAAILLFYFESVFTQQQY